MADFRDALKAEIKGLEAQLRHTELYQKLESLKAVLSLYDDNGVARDTTSPYLTGVFADLARVKSGLEAAKTGLQRSVTRVPSESRTKAMELAELYLRNRSGPTPTREILDHILAHGGEIGGQEPVSNLSAMLSNSDKFQSNGRAGWTLAGADIVSASDETLEAVVQYVFADLTSAEIENAYSYSEANKEVPQEMDAKLLSEARRRLGRFLTSGESARMRELGIKAMELSVFQ